MELKFERWNQAKILREQYVNTRKESIILTWQWREFLENNYECSTSMLTEAQPILNWIKRIHSALPIIYNNYVQDNREIIETSASIEVIFYT